MKKMIFSAVALVAFSFAGMANNENGEKKEVVKKTDPCVQVSFDFLDAIQEIQGCEYSPLEAGNILLAAHKLCEAGIIN